MSGSDVCSLVGVLRFTPVSLFHHHIDLFKFAGECAILSMIFIDCGGSNY